MNTEQVNGGTYNRETGEWNRYVSIAIGPYCRHMVVAAQQIGGGIWSDFNGYRLHAWPNTDPAALEDEWREWSLKQHEEAEARKIAEHKATAAKLALFDRLKEALRGALEWLEADAEEATGRSVDGPAAEIATARALLAEIEAKGEGG